MDDDIVLIDDTDNEELFSIDDDKKNELATNDDIDRLLEKI